MISIPRTCPLSHRYKPRSIPSSRRLPVRPTLPRWHLPTLPSQWTKDNPSNKHERSLRRPHPRTPIFPILEGLHSLLRLSQGSLTLPPSLPTRSLRYITH